jgi:NADH-quinone oxidoreductase subunit J
MGSPILFGLLALIALVAALGMVLSRNAIYSALFLILNMIALAVLYLALNAPFLAMVQITVYAGAIMVLFLFVIMLLGAERLGGISGLRDKIPGLIVAGALLVVLAGLVLAEAGAATSAAPAVDASPRAVGLALFQNFVVPFEITAVLLLVAMIGVAVWQTRRRQG